MTVKELSKEYHISKQAIYAEIQKYKNQLGGHVYKEECLKLDSFAEEMLKPVFAKEKFYEENTNMKKRLAEMTEGYEYFRDECSAKSEKISNLEKTLTDKNSEIEILQKQLDEQNSKNSDLIKSVERLAEEVTVKSKIIEKLQSDILEQTSRKSHKLFGIG